MTKRLRGGWDLCSSFFDQHRGPGILCVSVCGGDTPDVHVSLVGSCSFAHCMASRGFVRIPRINRKDALDNTQKDIDTKVEQQKKEKRCLRRYELK
jgi:hypothetical protein